MSIAVRTVVPKHAHKPAAPYSDYSSSRSSGANRTANDIIERINEAEARSHRPRSHAASLVRVERDSRSIGDIDAEIAALEAEARAQNLERKAFEERDLAAHIRERPASVVDYDIVEERAVQHKRRPRYEEELVLVEKDRSRSVSQRRGEIYITPEFRDDSYVVYERRRSPPRNVIRVERDRKGRMALVRSAH